MRSCRHHVSWELAFSCGGSGEHETLWVFSLRPPGAVFWHDLVAVGCPGTGQ